MSNFIGTAYFYSKSDAIEYFSKEGTDKKSVKKYIEEKLIHIGSPSHIPTRNLCINEGRYFIKEFKNE